MKKYYLIFALLAFLLVGFLTNDAKASITIATFSDPSNDSSNSLFTADFAALQLTGGWGDSKTGLTLQIPYTGHSYSNAWFDVSTILLTGQIVPGMPYYNTGGGTVHFYKDGTTINPLLTISFTGGFLSPYGFSANETMFTATDVTITGSEITNVLSQEQFSFSFANTASLLTHPGFTATASFTSSAVPEPATIGLLCAGGLTILRKKKRS